MTSLLLAIYCVSPATSSEEYVLPSFLREAGSVQAPLHTTQILSFIVQHKPIIGIKSSRFF